MIARIRSSVFRCAHLDACLLKTPTSDIQVYYRPIPINFQTPERNTIVLPASPQPSECLRDPDKTVELDWGCPRSPGEEIAGGATSPILKIRQVVLHLYLADGSLEIFEKRQVRIPHVGRCCSSVERCRQNRFSLLRSEPAGGKRPLSVNQARPSSRTLKRDDHSKDLVRWREAPNATVALGAADEGSSAP